MCEAKIDTGWRIGPRFATGLAMAIVLSLSTAVSGIEPLAEISIGENEFIAFGEGSFGEMPGTRLLSPDGTLLAAGVWFRTGTAIKLWDARTGKTAGKILPNNGVNTNGVWAITPDSKRLLAPNRTIDGLQLWDIATRKIKHNIRLPGLLPQLAPGLLVLDTGIDLD